MYHFICWQWPINHSNVAFANLYTSFEFFATIGACPNQWEEKKKVKRFFCIINIPLLTWNYNARGNQKLRSFTFLSYFVKPLFNFIIFSSNNVRWNLFHVYTNMSTENILFSNFWLYSSLCFITTLIKGLWLSILLK